MAAYHSDEILDGAELPLRYAAYSPCYRKEAGSHGKDTRGIFRVHWFDKVEMFVYTTLEESYAEHLRLLEWEKEFLDKLELAYRVIDVAAGDLGLSAIRKFDCEAWIPTQGKYRELTSTSNCTEFQTRRLDTRGRFGLETKPISTLNGTLCAMTRTIVAILESHQQKDGSVRVPKALQTWLGTTRNRLPSGGSSWWVQSTTAWCSESRPIRASGWSSSRPHPVAQVGRSAPRALLPESSTSRPPAWPTTVARQVSAMAEGCVVPSSHCWASPKT
jgi:hypothetical protein